MPKIVDHEERRWEITYAVWHLIATRGFEAVTLRAVAAEAGISVGRIQHYFSNKEAMVRHGCEALVAAAASDFDERTSDLSPAEALREFIAHAIPRTEAFRIGTTVWYAYLARSVDNPEIAAILREAKLGEQREAARLLREARKAAQKDTGLDEDATARSLLSVADGLATRVLIGQITGAEAVETLQRELDSIL